MARPLRITYPGAFYHITSRGNERKSVFKNKADRVGFLSYLESAAVRYNAAVHVYCLMDNHYHLLLETPSGNLSQIMRHINGAYTTYFNVKRNRSGHLFQGRYKAVLVEKDAYAKELSRYIHLNPVRAGMVAAPGDYEWSSYKAYVGTCSPPEWLIRDCILGYFDPQAANAGRRYRTFVESHIGVACDSPLRDVTGATILGSREFVDAVRAEHLAARRAGRDLPALSQLAGRPSAATIDAAVDRCDIEDPKLARNLKIYFARKCSGATLKTIGQRFGLGESGVSQVCRRIRKRAAVDGALKHMVADIGNTLKMSSV